MKKIILICVVLFTSGCAISPPFNNRMDYIELKQMRNISASISDVQIIWSPNSFPTEIEIKGASGFRGSAAQVRIPTGPSISSRLVEALDQSILVTNDSQNIVKIKIEHAESNFKFITGILNQDPAIDWGELLLEATFTYKDHTWQEKINYIQDDKQIDGSSLTKPLEVVWDKAAITMAKSIVKNINRVESTK